MNTKYDWALMEREYIAGDMSLRALAADHEVPNHSAVTAQARRREWAKKRAAFRAAADESAMVHMADDMGARRAQEARVRDHAIEAIDDAIQKMRADLRLTVPTLINNKWLDMPLVILKPADIVVLIDRLQVLFNRPSSITEERSLGVNLTGSESADFLRGIVEATRGLADTGGAAQSPFPRIDGARPD